MPATPSSARRAGRPPTLAAPRERILDAAAALFARSGYENSSISDLACAIGVSKAAIYHYYPTKQDIYDAIILDVLSGLLSAVTQACDPERGARARLRAFMVAHADYFETHHDQFVTMLVGYSGMASPERADAAALRDRYEGLLRAILAQGISEAVFRERDIAATGRAVLSLLNWMVRWYKPGQGQKAGVVAEDYFNLIAGGLCRSDTDTR
ncbi:TetR/AcrR family transcriptional regulator [Bordetella avium]|uniref:TetR-family trasncriptional regulator n=1 Tax=Bordetella avium (strain 197N) TaxID=360910 RepID=Q2KU54_BORA1|nr:TetR/AcrR family transcriptional regulator [Bordetella avium]AZY50525.1 TetR/AcrR family transcriptional regulator [Bordetella avium]AZY53921.1 TetR/AcrR family transcriptional regulator [Bordetella avium]RIQ15306.1 TetR/AcrR family transcriptional regulator [Bordetella avium]RIQ19889.1 TetR/AcrR family transcriptional regulator [Bordetella avium]RIQ34468.1 TetR/AcrR family transcriptional regulator [Bordetella avium]